MLDDQKLLADLASDDADVRFSAWRAAGEATPGVLGAVAKLAASPKPGVAKAAREAMTTFTHSVGKDPANPKRAGVVKNLLDIASGSGDMGVRAHALRLLSGIAGEDSVPAIAKLFSVPELREEVAFCIERIPGDASDTALLSAYKTVPEDFKGRILAGLGHRKTAAAAQVCADAMKSPNKELALAAVKAFGRIGKPTSPLPTPIDETGLSPFQVQEQWDAGLRWAEQQAKAGNANDAMRIYRLALGRPEEHLQCAAVIGLAKIGTSEAAATILPKLKSDNSRVRITAQKAWQAIATKG